MHSMKEHETQHLSLLAQERLLSEAATPPAQRTLKRYDALHGLLCEPEPLRSTIAADVASWIEKTAAAAP